MIYETDPHEHAAAAQRAMFNAGGQHNEVAQTYMQGAAVHALLALFYALNPTPPTTATTYQNYQDKDSRR